MDRERCQSTVIIHIGWRNSTPVNLLEAGRYEYRGFGSRVRGTTKYISGGKAGKFETTQVHPDVTCQKMIRHVASKDRMWKRKVDGPSNHLRTPGRVLSSAQHWVNAAIKLIRKLII
jgi:hypothetical protein